MTTTHHADPEARTSFRAPGWVRPKTVFLAALLVVLVFYTEMAFELDWRTTAGRIGPGFFPRIVGVTSLLITAWSLVAAIRDPDAEDEVVAMEDEVGDADFGKHPKLLTIMVLAMVAFTATLVSLGAIVSTAVFLHPDAHPAQPRPHRAQRVHRRRTAARHVPAVPVAAERRVARGHPAALLTTGT